jgi:cell division protein FtsL
MSLNIGSALSEGLDRSLKRNSLVLFVLVTAVGLLSTALSQTQLRDQFQQLQSTQPELLAELQQLPFLGGQLSPPFPLALPISGVAAQGLSLLMAFPNEIILLVAARTFVSDETSGLFEPTRNLPLATLNAVLGGIVVAVLVGIGMLLLVVPGLFLAVSFLFFREEVAVQDKNLIDAITDSYSLVKGDRFAVFGLILVLFLIGLVASAVTLVVPGVAGTIVSSVVGAAVTVFAAAVVGRAYVQLVESNRGQGTGALSADELEQEDTFGTREFDVGGENDDDDPGRP